MEIRFQTTSGCFGRVHLGSACGQGYTTSSVQTSYGRMSCHRAARYVLVRVERKREQTFVLLVVWAVFRTFRWVYHYDRECCRSGNGHISFVGKDAEIQFCRDKRMVLSCNQLSEDSGTDVCMEQYNESITHNRCPYYPLYTNGRCSRHLFSKTITGKGLPQFYNGYHLCVCNLVANMIFI